MNTFKIAVMMTRLVGLQLILLGVIQLSAIPKYLLMLNRSPTGFGGSYARLEISSLIIEFCAYLLCGTALYVFSLPIARQLTKGIESLKG